MDAKTSQFLQLLYEREKNGKKTRFACQRSMDEMSTTVPWNISRMQNMILCVGPGTPASTTITSYSSSASSSSSSSESESSSEEDGDHEDHREGHDEDNEGHHEHHHEDEEDVEVSDEVHEGLEALECFVSRPHRLEAGEANERLFDIAHANTLHGEDENENDVTTSRRRQRQLSDSSSDSAIDVPIYTYPNNDPSSDRSNSNSSHNSNTPSQHSHNSNISHHSNNSANSPNHHQASMTPCSPSLPIIKRPNVPAMKHGGCINTATWLNCSWRLSTIHDPDHNHQSSSHSSNHPPPRSRAQSFSSDHSSMAGGAAAAAAAAAADLKHRAIDTHECPTQLVTSGDDRLIKFWDVSHAMGSISPCMAGRTTETPFSTPHTSSKMYHHHHHHNHHNHDNNNNNNTHSNSSIFMNQIKEWKKDFKNGKHLSGTVIPLATLLSGHRGNVFHVTPIPGQKGKVATCAADGYLRLSDVETQAIPNIPNLSSLHRHPHDRLGGVYYSHSHNSHPHRGNGRGTASSQVIVSPEYDYDSMDERLGSLQSGMCFSHCFLNAHVGLLCSERGLKKFDIRLSPMNQQIRHVFWDGDSGFNRVGSGSSIRAYAGLSGIRKTCKACAIWKANEEEHMDSHYVFAGGTVGEVALFDLRMDSPSRVIQKYKPRHVTDYMHVSVSGIDLSKDGRELLVSYENDQIYTFPVFPNTSRSGPTIDDLNIDFKDGDKPLSELAAYGGHLNRFTFLKNAKYAGPNDEYICTGSDSGHAWIYERSTGAVASLLRADHSTCNGVIPHPTLPFFVTYGIDSTAKLWRATVPVDNNVDDSPNGRAQTYLTRSYEKSLIVRQWRSTQNCKMAISSFAQKGLSLLPDQIPSRNDPGESLYSMYSHRALLDARDGEEEPYIANDSQKVPDVLQRNFHDCTRAVATADDEPIQSGIVGFNRRVSLIRLRNQADCLGLKADAEVPWIMYSKQKHNIPGKNDQDGGNHGSINHPADLVPDYPSDWMQYDLEMTSDPNECGINFNRTQFEDFFRDVYQQFYHFTESSTANSDNGCSPKNTKDEERIQELSEKSPAIPSEMNQSITTREYIQEHIQPVLESSGETRENTSETSFNSSIEENENENPIDYKIKDNHSSTSIHMAIKNEKNSTDANISKKRCDIIESKFDSGNAWKILLDTVLLLKEGGNCALQSGYESLAARRYDKGIRYCAVAFQAFPCGNLKFLEKHQRELLSNGGFEVNWTPLLKALITIRLNLSLTMLKTSINDRKGAVGQAQLALDALRPFTAKKGYVLIGKQLERSREEPIETYMEAKELQAKAYFRLGTGQNANMDFGCAVQSYEKSIQCKHDIDADSAVDSIILRRLNEAKRNHIKKKKRHRKKFKGMFSVEGKSDNDDEDSKFGQNN